ncbi:hypothetical protein [Luteimonas kalidii]|uniref:Uncharacterized protein n=1 Tax=Luteimonas kalidii TaxID=3042025 RepID=A0ABT6JP03_9GAMM|nr:hypothetical protein [Luteimonas kalidii]MDH5832421.1 hypothetical protein [Luteimonas kalidii]
MDSWQRIDRPLLLCDGKLGEIVGVDGACIADYRPTPALQDALAALQAAPWMGGCLSNSP